MVNFEQVNLTVSLYMKCSGMANSTTMAALFVQAVVYEFSGN